MTHPFALNRRTNTPKILTIGGITADFVNVVADPLANDRKGPAKEKYVTLGGAAGNVLSTISGMSQAFEHRTNNVIITRIGTPPADDEIAQIAHRIATNRLAPFHTIDAMRGEFCIPFNTVIESPQGRSIITQQVSRTNIFADDLVSTIDKAVAASDIVFLDPKDPIPVSHAVEAAQKHGIPTLMDYSLTSWPTHDQNLAEIYDTLLRKSTYIMVPGDTVVEGMDDHVENPQLLFSRLKDHFDAQNIVMSDSTKPVRVLLNGTEQESIEINPHQGPIYTSGAGDTRDGAFMYFFAHGDTPLTAINKATEMASIKVQYPGRDWVRNFDRHRQPFEKAFGEISL